MPRSLTERQRRFVDAYLVTRNAKQAALDAGYEPEWASIIGAAQLDRPLIRAALRARGLDPAQRGVSAREQRFAAAYLVCCNAAEAARRIGIRPQSSASIGHRLLNRPRVAAIIEAERAASIARTRIDVDRVKREFARIAFMDIADIIEWDEEGIALKPSAQISPDDRAAIAELKLKPGEHGVKASVKLHSKQHALDSLAKLLGLYGKKPFVTIDYEEEKRAANAELRERLLRIVRRAVLQPGETKADEKTKAEQKEPQKSGA